MKNKWMLLQMEDLKDAYLLLTPMLCCVLSFAVHCFLLILTCHIYFFLPRIFTNQLLWVHLLLCSLYFYTLVVLLFKTIMLNKSIKFLVALLTLSQGQEFPWFWHVLFFVFLVLMNRSVTPIMISEPGNASWMQLSRTENLWKVRCVTRVNNAFRNND